MTQTPTPREIAEMTKRQGKTWAENNGGKTGAPPGLLQDDCRKLSRALANAPHARQHVREVCAAIAEEFSLSWCVHCGEGITNFCRSKCRNRVCPSGMPFIPSPRAGDSIEGEPS